MSAYRSGDACSACFRGIGDDGRVCQTCNGTRQHATDTMDPEDWIAVAGSGSREVSVPRASEATVRDEDRDLYWQPGEARPNEASADSDWTVSERGRSNSSPLYLKLVDDIAAMIESGAHSLLRGDSKSVARVILSQLAHVHRLAPRTEPAMPDAFRGKLLCILGREGTDASADTLLDDVRALRKVAEAVQALFAEFRNGQVASLVALEEALASLSESEDKGT